MSRKRQPFRIARGEMVHQFLQDRHKVQFLGGGFGNGKTAGVCYKGIQLSRWYPGSNGLIARANYPKLKDTIQKEFFKWCPPAWVKRMPTKDDNTCIMHNGTMVNFRHVAQQGKMKDDGSTSSNLLSATYDWIIVDQMEDPEFTEKDFDDLLGRLRGSTPYDPPSNEFDPTMPRSGPRWFIITANPTRNWLYKKLVKPVHLWQNERIKHPDLMVDPRTGEPMIQLFEGSTYENRHNLDDDFIIGLEAKYKGAMRRRFLMGEWAAYEGLVYPQYEEKFHILSHEMVLQYMEELWNKGFTLLPVEGYDHGLSAPSCYICGFVDPYGNIILLDGFYETELAIGRAARKIEHIRHQYRRFINFEDAPEIFADPSLFRRTASKQVGETVAQMFEDEGIFMQRGNADIESGIIKVSQYLFVQEKHRNPVTNNFGAPYIFATDRLTFWMDEIAEYRWATNTAGDMKEKPVDRNDHAMDVMKYMLTDLPDIGGLTQQINKTPTYMTWSEIDEPTTGTRRNHRYAA